jgi:hypothetical protein
MNRITKALLVGTALLGLAGPAHAALQLSIAAGGSVFTCSDGQLSCDQSGGAKALRLKLNAEGSQGK